MDNLELLPSILRRRSLPAFLTTAAAITVGAIQAASMQPIYQASARIVVDNQAVSVSELGQTLGDFKGSTPAGSNLLASQAELVKSKRILDQALDNLPQIATDNDEPLKPSDIRKTLRVKVLPATNILEIIYTNSSPELAASIVDEIAKTTINENSALIRSEATAVRIFLENAVATQEARLNSIEDAERTYRQQTGIVALETQTEKLVTRLSDIQNQERLLTAKLKELQIKDSTLKNITGTESVSRAYDRVRIGQNDQIKQIENQLLEIESSIIENQARLGPQHPDLMALEDQRNDLLRLYSQRLTAFTSDLPPNSANPGASEDISQEILSQYILDSIERSALEEHLRFIQSESFKVETALSEIPKYQQPLSSLIRQRDETTTSLSALSQKLKQAEIAEAQLVNNMRLIDSSSIPSAPINSPLASLFMATIGGITLSIFVIAVLELLDDRLHDRQELEYFFDQPVLGVLPKDLPAIPDLHSTETLLREPEWIEAHRLLLKTLEFYSQGKTNAFIFTGLQNGEGQVLTTAYLAATASKYLNNTLLIDANWHQPLQHLFVKAHLHPGLKEVLQSQTPSVQSTPIPSLDVIACGTVDAETHTYVEKPEMKELLSSKSEEYDFVMISAPPISKCGDAAIFSSYGAGLVLVTQANVTSRSMLKKTLSDLKNSGTEVLGIVMTQTSDSMQRHVLPIEPPCYSIPTKNTFPTTFSSKSNFLGGLAKTDKTN
jgi:polysaccharide biosynthesis transport protein